MNPPRGTVPAARLLLGLAILALVVAGFRTGLGSAPSLSAEAPAATSTATIVIDDFDYTPGSLVVRAGATVVVDNQDGVIHTVTALDGSFDTGEIAPHLPGRFTAPARPGLYPYRDTVLPVMGGTLVVT